MNEITYDPSYASEQRRILIHNQNSWAEAAEEPVLRVHCRDFQAELHKSRLGSGSRGRCIRFKDEWLTPTEFEAKAGRGSSKDWKRSIRFGGDTLHKLIEKGILAPHSTSCICPTCSGDGQPRGPIRFFTPYKRKRKSQDSRSFISGSPNDYMLLYQSEFSQRSDELNQPGVNPLQHLENLVQTAFSVIQQIKLKVEQAHLQQDSFLDSALIQTRIQCEADRKQRWIQQRMQLIGAVKPILNPEQEALLEQYYPLSKVMADRCAGCGVDAPMKNISPDEAIFYCNECQKLGGGINWTGHPVYAGMEKCEE